MRVALRGFFDERPFAPLVVLSVLVLAVGVAAVVFVAGRPSAGTVRPPLPPAEGQHGEVGYRAAGWGHTVDLRISPEGRFRIATGDRGPVVERSGQLPAADRAALADAVGTACGERLLLTYEGDAIDAAAVTVTVCGLVVQLQAGAEPTPLRGVTRLLGTLSYRLAGGA